MNEFVSAVRLRKEVQDAVVRKFEENGITLEVLKVATYHHLAALLQEAGANLGEEIRFESHLKKWQIDASSTIVIEVIDKSSTQSSSLAQEVNSYPISRNSPDLGIGSSQSSRNSPEQNVRNGSLPRNSPIPSSSQMGSLSPKSSHKTPGITAPQLAKALTEVSASQNFEPNVSHVGHTSSSKNLKEYLEQFGEGPSIMRYFENKKKLDSSMRYKLSNLLITKEMNGSTDPHLLLPASTFATLADDVRRIFPTEIVDEWYFPHFVDEESGRSTKAGGLLINHYHNYRRSLIKSGLLDPVRGKNKRARCVPSFDLVFEPTLEGTLNILKNPEVSFETAKKHWRETTLQRVQNFNLKYKDVDAYFTLYPVLKGDRGGLLTSLDFEELYPNHCDNFLVAWNDVKPKIIEHTRQKVEKDVNLAECVEENQIDLSETDHHLSTVNAFRLIGYFASICKGIRGTREPDDPLPPYPLWSVKKCDVMDGLLLLVKSGMDIFNVIQKKIDKHFEHGLRFQPLPVVVADEEKVIASYVYVNGFLYLCESPAEAIDTCFKFYCVTQREYSATSKLAWLFVQKYLFKLRFPNDSKATTPLNFARQIGLAK